MGTRPNLKRVSNPYFNISYLYSITKPSERRIYIVLFKIKNNLSICSCNHFSWFHDRFSEGIFEASLRGLTMWWEIVFPSLLPFFIVSEMLIGFGVVKFIGVLLEPLMRPLFRVPGVGGFVWAMGMASGFPAGAKLSARLRQEGQLTQIEAERLASFTNSSNPLFIFGAVAVGFFHNPQLGVILALAHYLGNICVGLMMRFYGNETPDRKKERIINLYLSPPFLHCIKLELKISGLLANFLEML